MINIIKLNWYTRLDGQEWLIDGGFVNNTLNLGSDNNLFKFQVNFMFTIMNAVLKNQKGLKLVQQYPNNPKSAMETAWSSSEQFKFFTEN